MGVPFVPAIARRRRRRRLLFSVPLERMLYRRLYGGDELDQVLLTIGLVFMSVAAAKFLWGPLAAAVPSAARGSRGQIDVRHARVSDLSQLPHRRRRGAGDAAVARARAHALRRADPRRGRQPPHGAVGRHQHLAACSPGPSRLGSGLAALGGALGAEILAIEPGYALEHLVYFLIVVSVGGLGIDPRAVLRGAAARRRRHRLQISAAGVRRLLHLCADARHPAVAAARPVRARMSADAAPRRHGRHGRRCLRAAPSPPLGRGAAVARGGRRLFRLSRLSRAGRAGARDDPVRAVARSDPRLCRHRHAGPCRVLRHRRLCRGTSGGAWLGRADERAYHRRAAPRRWSGSSPASSCCARRG